VESFGATTERHALRLAVDDAPLVGTWDTARLERVVANLLGNAVKYSPDGGPIVVRMAREEDSEGMAWAVLSVRDAGVGIPAADLPHVFDRFRRGGNVAGIAGAGIGLTGVRQIVEQHGGTVAVESEVGRGSTFTVRLPLARTEPG
jgi:signal transduction histidine kinase